MRPSNWRFLHPSCGRWIWQSKDWHVFFSAPGFLRFHTFKKRNGFYLDTCFISSTARFQPTKLNSWRLSSAHYVEGLPQAAFLCSKKNVSESLSPKKTPWPFMHGNDTMWIWPFLNKVLIGLQPSSNKKKVFQSLPSSRGRKNNSQA